MAEKKPEVKEATGTQDLQSMIQSIVNGTVKSVLESALPAMANAFKPPQAQRLQGQLQHKCDTCKQALIACKGEHEMLAVYPKNPRRGKWFQGLRLNGVLYISNGPGHEIPVPKENDFRQQIEKWEREEEEFYTGRQGSFESGAVGPAGNMFRSADGVGWR